MIISTLGFPTPPPTLLMVKSFRGRSLASSVRSSQDDCAPVLDPSLDSYAKVVESRGKSQFLVVLPDETSLLTYMPAKFRNALWIRRGSFVVVRRYAKEKEKEKWELMHVLTTEQVKEIKKEGKWPKEFENNAFEEENDSDDSNDNDYSDDGECNSNSDYSDDSE